MENSLSYQNFLQNRILKDVTCIVIIAVAYFVLARLSLNFIFEPEGIAAVWPASGIFLSAVLLVRNKLRPYLIGTLFITDFIAEMYAGSAVQVSLVYAFALTFDATFSFWLINRYLQKPFSLNRPGSILGFVLLSVVISNAVAASVAAWASWDFLGNYYWESWIIWWSSNAVGNLLVTPLILSWATWSWKKIFNIGLKTAFEISIFVGLLILINYLILQIPATDIRFFFAINLLTFPFLIWAAFRLDARQVTMAIVLISSMIIYVAINKNISVFENEEHAHLLNVFLIQLFLAIVSISTLILASLITAQRQAEKSLLETEERFKVLHNASFGGLLIHDKGQIIECNQGLTEITGYSYDELIGMDGLLLIAPGSRETVRNKIRQGFEKPYEVTGLRKNGETFPLRLEARNIPYKGTQVRSTEFRDLTEQRQLEQKLTGLSEIVAHSLNEIYVFEVENLKFAYVNSGALRNIGYSMEEISSLTPVDIKPEFTKETFQLAMNKLLCGEQEILHFETIHKRKNGTNYPVEVHLQLSHFNGKRVFVAFIIDITERKKAENELLNSRNELSSIYNTVGDVIFLLAVESKGTYRFISVNPAFCKVTGIHEEMVVGKLVNDVIPEPSLSMVFEKYQQAINEKSIIRWEEISNYPNGQLTGEVSVSPIFDEGGHCTHLVGSVHDVTENRKFENELARDKQRLTSIIEGTNVGTWEWNIQTGETVFNERWAETIGYTLDEISPVSIETWGKYTHPDDMKAARNLLEKHFNGEINNYECEIRMKHKNGDWIWILDRGKVYKWDEAGQPLLMSGTHQDITERRLNQEKINYLASIVRSSEDAIIGRDLIGTITSWNSGAEKLFGYGENEILGHSIMKIIPPGRHDEEAQILEKITQGESFLNFETIRLTKNGNYVPVSLTASPILDSSGKIVGASKVLRDITERTRAELEIARLNRFYRMLSNVNQATVHIHNKQEFLDKICQIAIQDGNFMMSWIGMKNAATNKVNVVASDGKTEDYLDNINIDLTNEKQSQGPTGRASKTGVAVFSNDIQNDETMIPWREKALKCGYRSIIALPLKIANQTIGAFTVYSGDVHYFSGPEIELLDKLAMDISFALEFIEIENERNQAEKKIIKLNETLEQRVIERTAQLEATNKELEAFSYSVSHDLRAPLRHISGFADMLKQDAQKVLPETSLHYLDIINNSAGKMGMLIDDLLSFSRTGRAELKKTKFNMLELVEELANQAKITHNNQKINFEIAKLPEVFADPNLLRLVWTNLIENAVKYSRLREESLIRINYSVLGKETICSIQDNGVGFDMKYAGKLFGVFQRMHSAAEFEGTGIGLANVQRIILKHGGRVWAEAEVDKGATFYFALPVKQ